MKKAGAKKSKGSRMIISTCKAVSRTYCLKKFNRKKLGWDATQDAKLMSEDQKKYDVHFTGVAYDKRYPDTVWCGFSSWAHDLLVTFNTKTKKFKSKGFIPLCEKEEKKIHRGLQIGPDGKVYFGTASLVTIKERHYAPGGRLFRYDPGKDEYEFLGRPVKHDYIQNIDVDHERGIVYGATYPAGWFFGWDIEKQKLLFNAYTVNVPHQVCVDDEGQCWATYSTLPGGGKLCLMKYSTKTGKLTWTDVTFPGNSGGVDSFVNGGDGYLYIGAHSGALLRLDPRKAKMDCIVQPSVASGFGALSQPIQGKIYGITGKDEFSQVFSYDLKTQAVVLYGPAYDDKRKTYNHRPHELVMGPNNCLYCPETDNFERQCYFWETKLK